MSNLLINHVFVIYGNKYGKDKLNSKSQSISSCLFRQCLERQECEIILPIFNHHLFSGISGLCWAVELFHENLRLLNHGSQHGKTLRKRGLTFFFSLIYYSSHYLFSSWLFLNLPILTAPRRAPVLNGANEDLWFLNKPNWTIECLIDKVKQCGYCIYVSTPVA